MSKQKIDTFILRNDFFPQVKMLSREQRGDLLTAIFAYATGEELPDMDPVTQMCFGFIKASLDANTERYQARCDKNRENGARGGRPSRKTEEAEVVPPALDETERFFKDPKETERFSEEPIAKKETLLNSSSSSSLISSSLSSSLSSLAEEAEEEDAGAAGAKREKDLRKFESTENLDEDYQGAAGAERPKSCGGKVESCEALREAVPGCASTITPQDEVVGFGKKHRQIDEKELRAQMLAVLCLEKGLMHPVTELERFEIHYAKTGWVDANGNPIRNRLAALKAWKPANEAPRLPPGVVKIWQALVSAIAVPLADCSSMVEYFRGLERERGTVRIIAADKRLVTFLERSDVMLTLRRVLAEHLPGVVAITYRVLRT